jgi:hypothetical protein
MTKIKDTITPLGEILARLTEALDSSNLLAKAFIMAVNK